MDQKEFNEKELAKVIEHIVHDKLPIASIGGKFIAPESSKEVEQRIKHGEYMHPEYGNFVFLGEKRV